MRPCMEADAKLEKKHRKLLTWISAFILAMGLIIYIGWGIVYGTWNILDTSGFGIYAVTVIMVLFGILGIILNLRKAQ